MPSKHPTLYSVHKTTIWFAIASIALLASLVAMVFKDGTREWKHYQREFIEYSRELAAEELEKAEHALDKKQIETLEKELAAAKELIRQNQAEILAFDEEIKPIDFQLTVVNTKYQTLKQHQDSEKYFFEEARAHHGNEQRIEALKKSMEDRADEIQAEKLKIESLEAQKEAILARKKAIVGKEKEITMEIKRLTGEVTRLEAKLDKLSPDWRSAVLNAPMLDFMSPTLQVQQIVLEDLHDDYYFAQVNKVDRCITCHLGIDQVAFEGAKEPFGAHPRLDLFVSADSPHPMEEFGCTACHGGSGHSVSFKTAAHTPQDEKQAAEWEKKYHWKPMKHWAEKMYPLNHVEASCAKCHTGTLHVPQAEKLNEGRDLARTFGCFNCHKAEGFEDYWQVGPGLRNVKSKLEADWIIRWLQNPKDFRASTKMPRVFHLSNTSDEASRDKSNASIAGIAAYLVNASEQIALESPKAKGNPEVGEKLVKELGCLGCHSLGEAKANNHGPELTGLGSKVSEDWLFTWLKNPKHYYQDSRMPDLRLSDSEAADITAYLLQDKNEKFESSQLPQIKTEVLDELAVKFLTGTKRYEEAKADVEKMSEAEKLQFVGQKSIQHQGCFGCHDIKGFETMPRIGAELTLEGSKDVHRFDFGFAHIPHTRRDWIYHKLKEPRIFDEGKEREYHDKLKMPNFDFTDEQAERLTTFVLSLVGTEIPMSKKRLLNEKEMEIEKGRVLVQKMNCQGCHTVDGVEGKARTLFEEIGNAPPVLDGEGKKVQPDWLHEFLKNPTPIRPWLTYRMPTFGLEGEELTAFVQYFNHLSNVPQVFADPHHVKIDPKELMTGKKLFESFQCIKCHKSNPEPGLSASFLAPDLAISKDRLRPDWVVDWLKDPQEIQAGTMMPGFFPDGESPVTDVYDGDADKQIKSIRDYLWQFDGEEKAVPAKAAAQA